MSQGRLLHGQQFDPRDNFATRFTQREMDKDRADAQLGVANTEIIPTDRDSSIVRVFTPPTTQLDAYSKIIATQVSGVDIPDVLESLTVTFSEVKGTASYSASANGASVGSNPSVSISLDGSAQNNVSIVADVTPSIRPFWGSNVKANVYFFKLTGNVTQAAILSKLTTMAGTTVNAWPRFNPLPIYLMITGQEVAIRVNVDVKQSVGLGSTASYIQATGAGTSQSVGVNTKIVAIPPTIHGVITIATPTHSDFVSAAATAGWPGGTNWPPLTRTQSVNSITVTASVSPTTFAATTPTSVPASGLYLYRIDQEEEEWGYTQIAATVIDFANL